MIFVHRKTPIQDREMWETVDRLVLVCLCYVVVRGVVSQPSNFRVVETPSGRIRGTCGRSETNRGVCEFLGIPFAKPPVGDLRFRHPHPLDARNSDAIYNPTEQPSACFQNLDTSFGEFPGASMWNPRANLSEDCLYLNVWTPQETHTRAVMVFIHGGSFTSGSISRYMFNASLLASENDVVVVKLHTELAYSDFSIWIIGSWKRRFLRSINGSSVGTTKY